MPQELLMSKGEGKWQSITKNCQRALTGKKLRQEQSKQKQSKRKTQFEWNDQSDKHSLIKGLEIKLNPLFDQSIKFILVVEFSSPSTSGKLEWQASHKTI